MMQLFGSPYSDTKITKLEGGKPVEDHVADDNRVFGKSKHGVDIGLAILIVPPVEIKRKNAASKDYLDQHLFVLNCYPLVVISCL